MAFRSFTKNLSRLKTLSVAENVLCGHLPKRFGHVDWPTARALASEVLARLGVTMDVNRIAEGLSIADQQLLDWQTPWPWVAQSLFLMRQQVPLTPAETRDLFRVIRALASEGCAIGIVSHHMHEIFEIADEITVLRDGKKIAHLETSKTTPSEVIRLMVGREIEKRSDEPRIQSELTVFQVENLSGPGFYDVTFSVAKGEIFGLAGLVGAGRTEVTRSIFGIEPMFQGRVLMGIQTC